MEETERERDEEAEKLYHKVLPHRKLKQQGHVCALEHINAGLDQYVSQDPLPLP